jgi:U3 small nucleolar RNA-associated protein 13
MTEIKYVEVVHDDNEVIQQEEQEEQEEVKQLQAVTLSKSWSISSAHVPTYSGGKIAHSRTKLGLAAVTQDDTASTPFLILPVNGDLALVDASKGTKIRTLRQDVIDNDDDDDDGMDADAITAYALSHDDDMLITCSRNQLIRQYSLKGDAKENKLWGKSGHTLPVTLMEFHPTNNVFVATASVDGSVRIWDVRGAYVTHVFRPYQGVESSGGMRSVSSICWKKTASSNELVIAIGREDGSIAIHDLRDKEDENLVVLRDHVSAVTCMSWSPDNTDLFVTSGRDAVINLWKSSTVVAAADDEGGSSPKKSKKKKKNTAAPAAAGRIMYQRIHTKPIYEQVEGMVVLKTSQSLLVATAGSMGNVKLWNYNNSKQALECIAEQPANQRFGNLKGGYMDLKLQSMEDEDDAEGEEQLVVADAEHNLLFLSLSSEKKLSTTRTIVGHNDEILDLKILPNGDEESTHAVVATNSAQVRLFNLGTFSCEILDGHSATVLCVDVSPCGRYISTCGKDKTMRIWQTSTCKSVAVATGHTEAIGATALSRKAGRYNVSGKAAVNGGGSFALTASKDRTLKRWNLPGSSVLDDESAKAFELKTFCSARAHEKDINIVSVAPNDSLVATGSQDKTIKLWKATDLSLQATLKGHKRGVWDCQFSPHDRVLASCSGDRTVKLWSLSDYSCVRTFQGHVAGALRVRFLSGGLQLVSAGADGLMKLWTIRTNECEATIDGHNNKVWALDLSPDGKKLVSGGADSQIVVWHDTTRQDEVTKRVEEEKNIILEQRLANHLRYKEYEKALDIALDLEKPRQVLKVLTSIVENDIQKGHSTGLRTLRDHCRTSWSMDKVTQILKYCRDWNTRARNSHMAMLVVQAVVTSIPAHKLAETEELAQVFAGITPYAERHFDRLDRMHANAYLLDYTLFSMGSLDDDGTTQKEYADWEAKSKLVLPPKKVDGRIQIGGNTVVGMSDPKLMSEEDEEDGDDAEVMSIGDSSDESDNEE